MYSSPSIIKERQLAGSANKLPSKDRAQWPALDKKSDCANGQRRGEGERIGGDMEEEEIQMTELEKEVEEESNNFLVDPKMALLATFCSILQVQ